MLAFLHVFHHLTTALLTFVEIKGKVSRVTDSLIEYLAFLLTFSYPGMVDSLPQLGSACHDVYAP